MSRRQKKPKPPLERDVQAATLDLCNRWPVRLWRNLVGRFLTDYGRWVQCGLEPGSADLIGYKSVVVTKEMIGQRLAIFTAIEIKKPGCKPDAQQEQWLDQVALDGGISAWTDSADDAFQFLHKDFPAG